MRPKRAIAVAGFADAPQAAEVRGGKRGARRGAFWVSWLLGFKRLSSG